MPLTPETLLLAGIVFFSYTAQTISGFGSTVIAVTLGAHLFALPMLLPTLVMLDLLLNGFLSIKYRTQIDHSLLFYRIIPLMAAGAIAGLLLFDVLSGDLLKTLLGVFVMGLSGWALLTFSAAKTEEEGHAWSQKLFFLLGGIVHGMYASGGPLVVLATSRLQVSKTVFRAVLTALWTLLSIIMTLFYFVKGQWNPDVARLTLLLLPAILAGLWLGERLHHRISERHFRFFIHVLLFGAGATLL